jgi:F-type H+-transporting ATPase subunit gamma
MRSGTSVSHPLLESRDKPSRAVLLVLTSNRGLCGGYNSSVTRIAIPRYRELSEGGCSVQVAVSGKRGIAALRFRGYAIDDAYTQFEDQPRFDQVEPIATSFLDQYATGQLDRLDVAYTRFVSSSRQEAVVDTLLPLGSLEEPTDSDEPEHLVREVAYEFLPSVESILQEIVPTSFKVKLFKCFLDAAVSEQIARMVAMKSATENASDMIRNLSRLYNRARQSQITSEISEIIGGVEALNQ